MKLAQILAILRTLYPIIRPSLVKAIQDPESEVDDLVIKVLDGLFT